MIAVVDYGLGNLRSIAGALEKLEVQHCITSDPALLSSAKGLILPGVGAFPDAMENLKNLNLITVLNDLVLERSRPILGICLGFQIMASRGFEFQETSGLGWFLGDVVRMESSDAGIRIPHVGWNDCFQVGSSPLFKDVPASSLFYFTHSFKMRCQSEEDVLAYSDHGERFIAGIHRKNIYGLQFHPEKSQRFGLKIIENFVKEICQAC